MRKKRRENTSNIGFIPYGRIVEYFYKGMPGRWTRREIREALNEVIKEWKVDGGIEHT